MRIADHTIDDASPVFIVAEMSANHLQDYNRAVRIVHAAAEAGADAIKLQTYRADTITLDSDKPYFKIGGGTLWDDKNYYQLYEEAYTPWEWHEGLMLEAEKAGLLCFSSPFDATAVQLMEDLNMPAFKIASYEITDIPLIRLCASKHKPVIIATGVATPEDIEEALAACRAEGNEDIMLLKCVSAYPTPYEEVNLRMMLDLRERFGVPVGLSDHTFGGTVAVMAVTLGARMVEKHLTLARADGGPDGAFSMEPAEFRQMVDEIRIAEKALGQKTYALTEKQQLEHTRARSLFVAEDIREGEALTEENIRSVRPGNGLAPKRLPDNLGKKATRNLESGEPLREGDFS